MSSRHVQNEPPPRCVRPRSARWNACECAFASPGSVTPRRCVASRGRSTPGDHGRDPPVVDRDQHVGDDALAAEPREIGVEHTQGV